ncbi:MAG: substrate-binding domain-containing protein [Paracoccaceae bacterium]|nr:substrate-binding domain-containing protein [Paracoccaceae bacterium]
MNLKELSDRLGLSQTTVSRALNGYPEVSEKTRQRVEDAAKRFNYTPNARAKRLATGRAMTIGHLLPMSKEHEMVNPVFADFLTGAGKRYAEEGYDLMLSVVADEDEADVYRDLAMRGSVDGVVVHGPKTDDARIALLTELGLPFVVHGRSSAVTTDYNWIDVNNRRAFERASSFLLDLGHRRVALINGLADMDFAARRFAGYKDAFEARGLSIDPDMVSHGEMTETYGHAVTQALLDSDAPPTALLISSIIPAIGARRAISDRGLKMGEDISVVIHDDDLSYFRNDGDVPTYTALRSSVREAGRQAASMLLEMISNPGGPTRNLLLEAEMMLGQSTGPAPGMRALIDEG